MRVCRSDCYLCWTTVQTNRKLKIFLFANKRIWTSYHWIQFVTIRGRFTRRRGDNFCQSNVCKIPFITDVLEKLRRFIRPGHCLKQNRFVCRICILIEHRMHVLCYLSVPMAACCFVSQTTVDKRLHLHINRLYTIHRGVEIVNLYESIITLHTALSDVLEKYKICFKNKELIKIIFLLFLFFSFQRLVVHNSISTIIVNTLLLCLFSDDRFWLLHLLVL